MTQIFLACGRWHSVRLAFVRLVKGLHRQACEALVDRLIFAAIAPYMHWTKLVNVAYDYLTLLPVQFK